jgi:hypothetical protein
MGGLGKRTKKRLTDIWKESMKEKEKKINGKK